MLKYKHDLQKKKTCATNPTLMSFLVTDSKIETNNCEKTNKQKKTFKGKSFNFKS